MEALLRLFLLPREELKEEGEDDEVVVADPDDLTYQAAFSKLGASEPSRNDPLASVGDAKDLLLKQLVSASQAAPGKVSHLSYPNSGVLLGLMLLCTVRPNAEFRSC